MIAVVDASVAAKWVLPEDNSQDARAWLDDEIELVAPESLLAEVASLLWKRTVRRQLTLAESSSCLSLLAEMPVELIPTRDLIEDALRLAVLLGHPVYDCLYVAAAMRHQGKLVTADRRLLGTLAGAGLPQVACWVGSPRSQG
ncbi:MAG TPA: type II toxin-antitoxin system VapC family toxin [Candidatus Binatia bacterium]|nr:type II toxin-antitoxin system VapC family toxin [Candidatus Binatia bacterium]